VILFKEFFSEILTKINSYYYRNKRSTILEQCIGVKMSEVMVKILQGSVFT